MKKKNQFQNNSLNNSCNDENIKFRNLLGKSLKDYYFGPNRFFYKGKPQILYLTFLGFLIVGIVVPFYYLSFQLVGVVFSTIFVNAIPILYIVLLNWVKKVEEMDSFKVIYLILLTAGIVTVTMSYESVESGTFSLLGFWVIVLTIIAFIAYTINIGRDSKRRESLFRNIPLSSELRDELQDDMRTLRSFYKLFGIHFMGNLIFVLIMFVMGILDGTTVIGIEARIFILEELPQSFSLLYNPFLIGIAVICTLIPYLIQVIASSNWPKHELGFDSWNSILTVLQPLVGLYIGFLIWQEPIAFEFIIITSIFLVVSIIIRYLHESANFRLVLFRIRIKNAEIQNLVQYMRVFREINEVSVTFGKIGIIFHASFRSLPRLFHIVQKLQTFPGVLEVEYFPEVEVISKEEE